MKNITSSSRNYSVERKGLPLAGWSSIFNSKFTPNTFKIIIFSALVCCFYAGLPHFAAAQTPGSLDSTFGSGGKVVTPIGGANDGVSAVVVQSDGKIVAAGYTDNGTNTDFALARYNANGTLDSTFGSGGKVVTPIGTSNDFISAAVLQSDGKIVVAGYASNGANLDFAVARYTTSGTLDSTFGSGGKVVTPIGSMDDFASSVAIQSDGKIVVAGAAEVSVFSNDFAVARYTASGSLDSTFGSGGVVTTPIGNADDFASSVAVQSDGKIVVAGAASDGTTDDFAVVRYTTNGTLDSTFGSGGKVVTPIGTSSDFASSVAIQSDGKIVVAGDYNTGSNEDFAVVRYTPNGTLDATFGGSGKVVIPVSLGNDFLNGIAIQSDGKIIAAGYSTGGTDDFATVRFNANGTLDSTFGTSGKVITPIGTSSDFASSVAIQSDGKIVVAGSSDNGTNLDFALVRYFGVNLNNPVPTITNLNPSNKLTGSGAFELTVTGTNFITASVVRFNGQDRATTFVSDTQLKAQILASDVQTAGQFPVTVFNPAPAGGVSNALNFVVNACLYSLNPTSQNFTAAGGNGSTMIITPAGCTYNAVSNAPWITITSGGSGTGNGTVAFTVGANTGPDRTGTITIAGQTFTVNQDGGCTYSISPTSASFGANGGTGSFAVTTSNVGCAYTATTTAAWITITNGTGTGSGTVTFTVAANTGADRTGTITINGQIFTVTQSGGCSYTLSPTSANFTSTGGTGSFTVTTGTGCAYTATSNASWIVVNNGTGTGNGTVTFTVSANTGSDRTGTISVNGQTFTVNQSGGCTYSISPTSANFGNSGGTGSFVVTTTAGCMFTATSNASWITINSGGNGTGTGTVNFTVSANTGSSRTGTITVNGQIFTVNQTGATNTVRTAFDFDGDGKADISVFRPDNGIWYLLNSQTGFTGIQFGISTDRLVPADYDGDGKTDVAVYRDGAWYLQRSSLGFVGISFGAATDIPVAADFDGDGKAELAVYRPLNGTWYIYNLATNQTSGVSFGANEDKPVAGDYDGDGKADVAVFRPSNGTWYLQRSTAGFTGIQFGDANDKAVPADYDGDGKTDVAVFRPSNGTWYLQRSTAGFTGVAFGAAADLPTPADFDGDGKADVAVFRSGTWYIQRSTQGFTGVSFGAATDKPVPNAFVR